MAINLSRLPTAPAASGVSSDDLARKNINWLLNPNYDTSEVDTRAAEKAVGGGYSGSNFANLGRNLMRDSERIRRMELGQQMLAPYQQRDFQASQAAADRAHQLQLAVMQGEQAMQRLAASERGMTERLTMQERAAMEQLIRQGQDAKDRLQTELQSRIKLQADELAGRKDLQALSDAAAMERLKFSEGAANTRQGNQIASSNYQAGLNRTTGSGASSMGFGPSWQTPSMPTTTGGAVASSLLEKYMPKSDPWADLQTSWNALNPSGRQGSGGVDYIRDAGDLGFLDNGDFSQDDEWNFFGA